MLCLIHFSGTLYLVVVFITRDITVKILKVGKELFKYLIPISCYVFIAITQECFLGPRKGKKHLNYLNFMNVVRIFYAVGKNISYNIKYFLK